MKSMVFDSSSIISLATNNLLWVLEPLKERFKGKFCIGSSVKQEIIDVPINGKRFRLEAVMILDLLRDGVLELVEDVKINETADKLMSLSGSIFETKGEYIQVIHKGEVQSLALVKYLSSNAYIIDERTTRLLVENPKKLTSILLNKLHSRINVNKNNLDEFRKEAGNVDIIRSIELMVYAYDTGLLDEYVKGKVDIGFKVDLKRTLLEGLLWGLKLRGCSISTEEIDEILKMKKY